MAVPLGRTFSFDNNDEVSMNASNTVRDMQHFSPPAYENLPMRQHDEGPPPPPIHRSRVTSSYQLPPLSTGQEFENVYRSRDLDHSTSNRTASTTTPGADNMGEEAAGGGIAGVALGVANTHARESGIEAIYSGRNFTQQGHSLPTERSYNTTGSDTPYIPAPPSSHRMSQHQDPFSSPALSRRSNPFDDDGRGSLPPSPGQYTPRAHRSSNSIPVSEYTSQYPHANGRSSYSDNPYKRFSTAWDTRVDRGDFDPNNIEDDGDDGITRPIHVRRSILGLNTQSQRGGPEGAAAAGLTSTGGVLGALGGLVGRKNNVVSGARDASGQYGPVGGHTPGEGGAEKSDWLNRQTSGRKRLRWIVGIIIALIAVGAIAGGVIGGLHRSSSSNSDSSSDTLGASAAADDSKGDLDKDSAEIKKLMGNPGLHKVFPGMDYTPFNAQYPACLSNPPSQNNVTRDLAVLSQLTNTVRLYGTDCNQTEMVLHALDKLALPQIKVWLGVWLDKNTTTNDRGLNAMYDILSKNPADRFAGVIIGNEVLYRKELTESQLGDILSGVRTNLTSQKIDLPVAASDLGDDWTPGLAANVDVVMSNVHPFFAGVAVDIAAGWTWNFWQEHDIILTKGTSQKNVISEVGWPSGGGTDCGQAATCSSGSVAGVDEMNTFMADFVCQSLANGTNYFW